MENFLNLFPSYNNFETLPILTNITPNSIEEEITSNIGIAIHTPSVGVHCQYINNYMVIK